MLKLNYTKKTLNALSGGDDTIFVILDDRSDVWLNDGQPVENLLRIPPYFHFEDNHLKQYTSAMWYEKEVRKVTQMCDFDITLIIFLSHLKKIHTQFFADFEEKDDYLKDTKYYIRKLKNEIFSLDKVISFEHLIPAEANVATSFEG